MTESAADESRVDSHETVSRFILQGNHLRADLTARPSAFIPHPHRELSVTCQAGLTEVQLWALGKLLAGQCGKRLRARIDVLTAIFEEQSLRVLHAPEEGNANHANVTDWPADKPGQMQIGQEISASVGPAILVPSSSTAEKD